MKIKVSKYISEFFVKHGIVDCFMVTGGGAMHLDDAIGHQEGIRCILIIMNRDVRLLLKHTQE